MIMPGHFLVENIADSDAVEVVTQAVAALCMQTGKKADIELMNRAINLYNHGHTSCDDLLQQLQNRRLH